MFPIFLISQGVLDPGELNHKPAERPELHGVDVVDQRESHANPSHFLSS